MKRRQREEWETIGRGAPGLHIGHWPREIGAFLRGKLADLARFHSLTRLGTVWYALIFVGTTGFAMWGLTHVLGDWISSYAALATAFVVTWAVFRWVERSGTDFLGGISILIGLTITLALVNLPILPFFLLSSAGAGRLGESLKEILLVYLGMIAFVAAGTTCLCWMRNASPGAVLKDAVSRIGMGK